MLSISKLIKLWAMGKFFSSRTNILHKLIMRVAVVAILGIVISVMASCFIAGGLAILYTEMLYHGIDHYAAISVVVSLAIAMLALLGLIACSYWLRVTRLMQRLLKQQAPFAMRAGEVVNAFFDGLLGEGRL